MLTQDCLRILLALYDRQLAEVAEAAGMTTSTVSRLINCRYQATPEQIARLEAAIIGARRLLPYIGPEDRALVA